MSKDSTQQDLASLPLELKQAAYEIGLIELTHEEIRKQYKDLNKLIAAGLDRKAGKEMHKGEIAAIRTGIPIISTQMWQKVPPGSQIIVCEVAGTNFNFCVAEKEPNGNISITHFPNYSTSYKLAERQISFQAFIDRIAVPIMQVNNDIGNKDPIDFGVSLGHYLTNKITSYGIEANLLTRDGTLSKGWYINDWLSIPTTERGLIAGVQKKLRALGLRAGQGIAINDTCAVALDEDAINKATNLGYSVLPASFVGGTGINATIDQNGLINLELGHPLWHDTPLSNTMRKKLRGEGKLDTDLPEPEHETGQYIPLRLAIGINLLGQKNLLPEANNISAQIINSIANNPKLISDIAIGKISFTDNKKTNSLIRRFSLGALQRAGQTYGILFASIAQSILNGDQNGVPYALLTEGSAIHKGYGLQEEAERIAAYLGHPVKIIEATGLKGIGALAMAYSQIAK